MEVTTGPHSAWWSYKQLPLSKNMVLLLDDVFATLSVEEREQREQTWDARSALSDIREEQYEGGPGESDQWSHECFTGSTRITIGSMMVISPGASANSGYKLVSRPGNDNDTFLTARKALLRKLGYDEDTCDGRYPILPCRFDLAPDLGTFVRSQTGLQVLPRNGQHFQLTVFSPTGNFIRLPLDVCSAAKSDAIFGAFKSIVEHGPSLDSWLTAMPIPLELRGPEHLCRLCTLSPAATQGGPSRRYPYIRLPVPRGQRIKTLFIDVNISSQMVEDETVPNKLVILFGVCGVGSMEETVLRFRRPGEREWVDRGGV